MVVWGQVSDALHALQGGIAAIQRVHPSAAFMSPRRLRDTGAAAVAAAVAPFALAGLHRRRLTAFAAHFSARSQHGAWGASEASVKRVEGEGSSI